MLLYNQPTFVESEKASFPGFLVLHDTVNHKSIWHDKRIVKVYDYNERTEMVSVNLMAQ